MPTSWRIVPIETPNQFFDAMERLYWDCYPEDIEEMIRTGEHDLFCEYPTKAGIAYSDQLGLIGSAECREQLADWYFLDRGCRPSAVSSRS